MHFITTISDWCEHFALFIDLLHFFNCWKVNCATKLWLKFEDYAMTLLHPLWWFIGLLDVVALWRSHSLTASISRPFALCWLLSDSSWLYLVLPLPKSVPVRQWLSYYFLLFECQPFYALVPNVNESGPKVAESQFSKQTLLYRCNIHLPYYFHSCLSKV